MSAFVFPAGDPEQRQTVADDYKAKRPPPDHWSVDVNRGKVKAGDLAFFWQTGIAVDIWTPGIWAAGVVGHFDRNRLEPNWRRGSTPKIPYAYLELRWVPIIDRGTIRSIADVKGSVWAGSILGSRKQGQMRSPLLLGDPQCDWLLAQIPRATAAWMKKHSRDLGT